jgi:hypothetical protein
MCGCGIRHDAWVWHSHFVPCSPQRSSSARYWTFQSLAVSYYLAHDELPAAGSCKYLVLKSIWSSTTRWKTIGSVHTALCRIRTELQLACEPRGASPASEPRGASPASEPRGASPASEPRGASPASEPRGASPPSIAPPPIRASIVEFESSLLNRRRIVRSSPPACGAAAPHTAPEAPEEPGTPSSGPRRAPHTAGHARRGSTHPTCQENAKACAHARCIR